jgi:20S proteasome alpha/beta subunit
MTMRTMMMTMRAVVLAVAVSAGFAAAASTGSDPRYSFSLTTFDPSGRLGQVERAQLAAALGPPVVVVVVREEEEDRPGSSRRDGAAGRRVLLMAAPQALPSSSMLEEDDGTSRFARITPEIVAGHSGLSADGRFVLSRAQRLAVEHEYAYDEPVPVGVLLEEMSLLYQQYTMKAAARPLGTSLLVAHLPRSEDEPFGLFRLDPSGNVEEIRDNVFVMNGGSIERTQLRSRLEGIGMASSRSEPTGPEATNPDLALEVAEALRGAIGEQAARRGKPLHQQPPATSGGVSGDDPTAVVVASLSRDEFAVRRYD